MSETYRFAYEGGVGELVEKKSRFIATVTPVTSEEEALRFIEQTKKKYWDARHNCTAFTIGSRHQLTRCSDDGEPAGTAGRPMLDVLLKEDIHNKMNRLLKKLESDHDRIIVESGNRIVAIYYDDIQYIHTDKNYIVIHGREEYKIRSTFKDFIKKIKKNDFITISYGILVNMRYVQYINLKEMMVVLENEIQLPLSYKYKNSVKEAYQEYKIR